jgi:ectoine hydroxylase-related dioxygenase (phytanoyl-CoA dioxygenase family)
MQSEQLIQRVESDGFVVIPRLLDAQSVLRARQDLVALLDEDLATRVNGTVRGGVNYEATDGKLYPRSVFEPEQHTLYFPTAYSAAVRHLVEQIVSNPQIKAFTDRVLGKNFRLRVDYVRRLTGVNDEVHHFELPHEWHRDNPGAFTFGIFFDDVAASSGATTALRGTHWEPYDPRFEMLFSERSYLSRNKYPGRCGSKLMRYAVASRLARRRLRNEIVEMAGAPGDVYFFLNDVWHGRAPNIRGSKNIILRFNGYPTEFEAPENVPLHAACAGYTGEIGRRFSRQQVRNSDSTTLMQRMMGRKPRRNLVAVAAWEKRALTSAGEALGWFTAQLKINQRSIAPGQSIEAGWRGIPNPTRTDYISIYDSTGNAVTYAYLAKANGRARARGKVALKLPEGIHSGEYEMRLYSGDTGVILARASFGVAA